MCQDVDQSLRCMGSSSQGWEQVEPTGRDWAQRKVHISPQSAVTRRSVAGAGLIAELVQVRRAERIESYFRAPVHLLVVGLEGSRISGETSVKG
jgi:hypothetical protein